jgi:hypothetical protein
MGISSLLVHRVTRIRQVRLVDGDGADILDELGQPVTADDSKPGIAAAIQPKSAREVAAIHQAGASISTHTIYTIERDFSTADAIVHDPELCPVTADLPAGRYELTGIPDAAGVGHHLELDAVLIGPPAVAATTGGSGS